MTESVRVTFEGLVDPAGVGDVPVDYSGLYWSNAAVIGKSYLDSNYQDDGYHSVLSGNVVGWARAVSTIQAEFMIIAQAGTSFTISKGNFASAWNVGETLTFTAYKNGQVKSVLTVTVDNVMETISFGRGFRNIDELIVVGSGGEAADPVEGPGASPIFAFDNLKVSIKSTLPGPGLEQSVPAADFMTSDEAMFRPWQTQDSNWLL